MITYKTYKICHPPMTALLCIKCGHHFAVADSVFELRQADGKLLSCPLGHRQRLFKPDVTAECADNAVLKAQVEFLSKRIKDTERASGNP